MPDYSDHAEVLAILKESQEDDSDNRDRGREAHLFIDKRDGQWEPYWWNINEGKPRYTFDMTGPIVDQVAGDMENADFDIKIKPAGGDTTKDDAQLIDGLIRNIENVSNANDIFNLAGRNMVTAGIDGWQIKQKYVDDDSFDQDLVIEPIANFIDSVWFGPFKKPDASDARWCVVLEAMDKRTYDEKYPEGSGMSVGDNRLSQAYSQKFDQIIIGNLYYIEERPRTLLKMSSGRILEEEQVATVLDELAANGDVVVERRVRAKHIVKSRLFDGHQWLNDAQETVFNQIPVIPTIGNFKIFENKLLYRGVVEKLLDPQRVFNYAKSREIEEGALAPRSKYWMTRKQSEGEEDTIQTLNTNADPVQFYTPDPEAPGVPEQNGGAQINPGLRTVGEDMKMVVQQTAGLFAASMGDNPGLQSGVAIEKLQDKGDIGTQKYFAAQERAICRTARILIDAIPVVYNTRRQVRILKEDGSFDVTTLNQPVFDQQTQRMVTVNDVSKGKYDVTCSAGPSFQNRQQETVSAITEISAVDPTAIQLGGDILYSNMTSPGMDALAERKRQQLFQSGLIPFDQMTDQEKEQTIQAQQQPQQPDAATMIAMAEMGKSQAQTNKVNVEAQVAERREAREDWKAQQQVAQKQQEIDLKEIFGMMQQQQAAQAQLVELVSTQADTLKTIREAIGVDSIVGPANTAAYVAQAENLNGAVRDSNLTQ